MKTEIKVAVSYVKVTHEIKTVDLPEENVFMIKGEPGKYDSELFAIMLYGSNKQSGHYNLLWIKSNEQLSTDFIPRKDVTSEYWVDGNEFRKTAITIITKEWSGWKAITKDEFLTLRTEMLDRYITELL